MLLASVVTSGTACRTHQVTPGSLEDWMTDQIKLIWQSNNTSFVECPGGIFLQSPFTPTLEERMPARVSLVVVPPLRHMIHMPDTDSIYNMTAVQERLVPRGCGDTPRECHSVTKLCFRASGLTLRGLLKIILYYLHTHSTPPESV